MIDRKTTPNYYTLLNSRNGILNDVAFILLTYHEHFPPQSLHLFSSDYFVFAQSRLFETQTGNLLNSLYVLESFIREVFPGVRQGIPIRWSVCLIAFLLAFLTAAC